MTSPEFTSNRDNYCYRHPDRQSFVLCQRCMRTICPECQTQAAVGVICPECMKAERKNRTPAQKRAARRWGRSSGASAVAIGNGRAGRPLVTYVLLIITSFVSLVQMIPGFGQALESQLFFAAPYIMPTVSVYPFEPWRLLTALLVHGGFIHLGLNMLALWMLGQILEPMLGRARFLALYLISGLGGSVMAACLAPLTGVQGASGAIFGLMAALLIIGRHIGANVTGILIILGINFAFGLFSGGISWQAHLGGVVVGALVSFLFTRLRRREQRVWLIVSLAGVVILLLAAAFLIPPLVVFSFS
ncbi:rhomboid family intramembrane serine protease [Microbacterium sp. ZW T5_45]|uniref:rhomboid family intramembrane serine protease n=1 Tax=Microbacterium sp. ZW T5_45 TaxID=3378080 RepID=UPI003854A339